MMSMLSERKTLELRPYQIAAIDDLREGLRAGHKYQILCAPTGSGKTEMAFHLVQEALAKGTRLAFVCDRRVLVQQTHERLSDYGIPHGVTMAGAMFGRGERIQVCSAQTLEAMDSFPDFQTLVLDEAHNQRAKILAHARERGIPIVGLTATPLTPNLRKTYTRISNATTTNKLLAEGWLAPLRIYEAKATIDMDGLAPASTGEWSGSQVRSLDRAALSETSSASGQSSSTTTSGGQ